MIFISNNEKLTKEMIKYEEETGKKALWKGNITEKFKRWQRGEKIYDKDKERIGILISEEAKVKWQKFANENNISTISKLIRKAVDFYIDYKSKKASEMDFSSISQEFRRPLTSIKGFAQLLIENHKAELSWESLLKVKEIIDNSIILEDKIEIILDKRPIDKDQYEILIVDDDESTINLLLNFFESRGYKCKESFLGKEAIEFLNTYKPKLILLDILLPDISGYEICKTIKLNNKLKDIPIFYITAVTEPEVSQKLKETGAEGYFTKPFNLSEFNILFDYLKLERGKKKVKR